MRGYKGHFKNDANILDIIYGTAKLKMFAELFCAYVVVIVIGWLVLCMMIRMLLGPRERYTKSVCVSDRGRKRERESIREGNRVYECVVILFDLLQSRVENNQKAHSL